MTTNIAINGMGRIGRMVLRIALKNENLSVKAINASYLQKQLHILSIMIQLMVSTMKGRSH